MATKTGDLIVVNPSCSIFKPTWGLWPWSSIRWTKDAEGGGRSIHEFSWPHWKWRYSSQLATYSNGSSSKMEKGSLLALVSFRNGWFNHHQVCIAKCKPSFNYFCIFLLVWRNGQTQMPMQIPCHRSPCCVTKESIALKNSAAIASQDLSCTIELKRPQPMDERNWNLNNLKKLNLEVVFCN